MFTATALNQLLSFVVTAHSDSPTRPQKAFRKADGVTPYAIHPIWCGLTLLQEPSLPEDLRVRGTFALFLHDVLEDTTAVLPADLPEGVVELVQQMTFPGGSAEEHATLWDRPAEVILLKLYDKLSNILTPFTTDPAKRAAERAHLLRIVETVEAAYGELHATRFARALLH